MQNAEQKIENLIEEAFLERVQNIFSFLFESKKKYFGFLTDDEFEFILKNPKKNADKIKYQKMPN